MCRVFKLISRSNRPLYRKKLVRKVLLSARPNQYIPKGVQLGGFGGQFACSRARADPETIVWRSKPDWRFIHQSFVSTPPPPPPTYGDSCWIAGLRCTVIIFWLSPQGRGSARVTSLRNLTKWDFLLCRAGLREGLLSPACPHRRDLYQGSEKWKVIILTFPRRWGGGGGGGSGYKLVVLYLLFTSSDFYHKFGPALRGF